MVRLTDVGAVVAYYIKMVIIFKMHLMLLKKNNSSKNKIIVNKIVVKTTVVKLILLMKRHFDFLAITLGRRILTQGDISSVRQSIMNGL